MKRAALVTAAAATIALWLGAGSAHAASITAIGWWTRSPAASSPENGIAVANSVDGPVSVAAIRVDVDNGVRGATINLTQAGGTAPTSAQLVTCVLDAAWDPAAGGDLATAPATSCSGTVATVTGDGAAWTVNVQDLVGDRTGEVSFLFAPALGSTSIWELQFERPSFEGSAVPSTKQSTTPTTAARPATAPATVSASTPTPVSSASSYTPPPAPRPAVPVAATPTTVAPATEASDVAQPSSGTGELASSSSAEDTEAEDRPIGQAIVMVLIAAAVGIGGGIVHKVVSARIAPS